MIFVFIVLMLLLFATYALAHVNLGAFNLPVSLLIACAKAFLVAVFFMHLKKAHAIHRIFALAGVFWLCILLALSLADYLSRGWLPLPGSWPQF